MKWVVKELDRASMGSRINEIRFDSLKELIAYLKRFIPDCTGYCGNYYEFDILEIKPVVEE